MRHHLIIIALSTALASSTAWGQSMSPSQSDADAPAQADASAAESVGEEPIPEAETNPNDSCPTLPENSGLTWTYQQGPDFGVCYAALQGSSSSVFGIYLGNYPSFHPERATALDKGNVGGKQVIWYRQDQTDDNSPFARQTLLMLDGQSGFVAHIWVTADTDKQLKDRLAILERITFKH